MQGDFFRYNAVGDGVAADTVAVQKAFTVGGDLTCRTGSTFLVSALTSTVSFRVVGAGTIKQSANAGVNMLTISGSGVSADLGGATYDGNQAAQGANPANFTVSFAGLGTSSVPVVFRAKGATFQNGGVGDVQVTGTQTGELLYAFIEDCNFFGGALGDAGGTYFPRSINIQDGVDYLISGCSFDIGQSPIAGGKAGRAGIVGYFNQSESTPTPGPPFTAWGRPRIIGNRFNRMGRDQANGQGSIDMYGYNVDGVIEGNVITNPVCRGINVKGSCPRMQVQNNIVDTAFPGLSQTVTGIVCNASTTTDGYNDLLIQGNTVNAMTYDGIAVIGFNVSGALTRTGVQVRGNTVRGCGSGGTGVDIRFQAVQNGSISGNHLIGNGGSSASVQFQQCQGLIEIKDNQIISPAQRAVLCNTGDNNGLAYFDVRGNYVYGAGNASTGCAFYFSQIGGLRYDQKSNRIENPGSATAIFTDSSAVVSATTSGTVMTIASVSSGPVAVGQLVTSAPGAAAVVSIPGTFIASFGTFTNAIGSGTVNLSQSPANIAGAQSFWLHGPSPGTTEANIKTCTLNNNTEGVLVVQGSGTYFIDTASAAATGLCYWIHGGAPGDEITLTPLNGGRMTTVKKNSASLTTGNCNLTADWVPTVTTNSLTLVYTGVEWRQKAAN